MFCFEAAPSDLRGLPGFSPRKSPTALQRNNTRRARRTVGRTKTTLRFPSVFMHARSSFRASWIACVRCFSAAISYLRLGRRDSSPHRVRRLCRPQVYASLEMAALAGAWAREVAADAWPGPVCEGAKTTRWRVASRPLPSPGSSSTGDASVCPVITHEVRGRFPRLRQAATQDVERTTPSVGGTRRWRRRHI